MHSISSFIGSVFYSQKMHEVSEDICFFTRLPYSELAHPALLLCCAKICEKSGLVEYLAQNPKLCPCCRSNKKPEYIECKPGDNFSYEVSELNPSIKNFLDGPIIKTLLIAKNVLSNLFVKVTPCVPILTPGGLILAGANLLAYNVPQDSYMGQEMNDDFPFTPAQGLANLVAIPLAGYATLKVIDKQIPLFRELSKRLGNNLQRPPESIPEIWASKPSESFSSKKTITVYSERDRKVSSVVVALERPNPQK